MSERMDRWALRPAEVGEALGVSRSKAYELIANKTNPIHPHRLVGACAGERAARVAHPATAAAVNEPNPRGREAGAPRSRHRNWRRASRQQARNRRTNRGRA